MEGRHTERNNSCIALAHPKQGTALISYMYFAMVCPPALRWALQDVPVQNSGYATVFQQNFI